MKKDNDYSITNTVDKSIPYRNALDSGGWNISREDGNILKGLAIAMMFVHHVFSTAPWYITRPDIPVVLTDIGHWCKLCVGIFAFLTGWFYAKGKPKGKDYPFRKSLHFYFSYLLTFIFLAAIALFFCHWRPLFIDIFHELIPLGDHQLMYFCWYVVFYPLILLLLAFCDTLQRHLPSFAKNLSAIIIFLVLLFVAGQYAPEDLAIWLPTPIIGYYLSGSKRVSAFLHFCVGKRFYFIILCATAILSLLHLAAFAAPKVVFHLTSPILVGKLSFLWREGFQTGFIDSVYVMTFMLLIPRITWRIPRRVLAFLGTISMNMWFLHCLFFSEVTRDVFQPIITCLSHPLFTLVTLTILCIPPAILLQKIQQYATRKIFTR